MSRDSLLTLWLDFSPTLLLRIKGVKIMEYFKLKESEYRTVNGLKVLYLRYIANAKGLDFEYQMYAYLTENGYCSVTSYTFAKYFDQNKAELDRFLNGLVETKKAETVENSVSMVEYKEPIFARIKKWFKQTFKKY